MSDSATLPESPHRRWSWLALATALTVGDRKQDKRARLGLVASVLLVPAIVTLYRDRQEEIDQLRELRAQESAAFVSALRELRDSQEAMTSALAQLTEANQTVVQLAVDRLSGPIPQAKVTARPVPRGFR